MADARRVEMDREAYQRLVRRAWFVCELLAGNPDYPTTSSSGTGPR